MLKTWSIWNILDFGVFAYVCKERSWTQVWMQSSFLFHIHLIWIAQMWFYIIFSVHLHYDHGPSQKTRCGTFHLCHVGSQEVLDFGEFKILYFQIMDAQPVFSQNMFPPYGLLPWTDYSKFHVLKVHPSFKWFTPTCQKIVVIYWYVRTRIYCHTLGRKNVMNIQIQSIYYVYGVP